MRQIGFRHSLLGERMRNSRLIIILAALWPLLAVAEVNSARESQVILGALLTPVGAINSEWESAGLLMLYTPGGEPASSSGSGRNRHVRQLPQDRQRDRR